MRSRLILSGAVQQVGFRSIIKGYAQGDGIKGQVKNLEDGTVEIYCEYRDKEQLNRFEGFLNSAKSASGLKVERIEKYDEGTEQYGEIDEKAFKTFTVYYMEGLTPYEIDQADRSELTVYYGMQMYSSMNTGFDKLGGKIDKLGDDLGGKIDLMHGDMNKRFDALHEKYGAIGQIMIKFLEQQEEHNKKLDELLRILTEEKRRKKNKA